MKILIIVTSTETFANGKLPEVIGKGSVISPYRMLVDRDCI